MGSMEVDSNYWPSYSVETSPYIKPSKKRRADISVTEYEIECAVRGVSSLKLDAPFCDSIEGEHETHVLELPGYMVPPPLANIDPNAQYPGLGDLCIEIHLQICQYLPQNDIWNLSRCNRAMCRSFPASILQFRTRGSNLIAIANQLQALHRTPKLQELTIDSFRAPSHAWAKELVTNCPNLRRLRLVNCHLPVLAYAAFSFLHNLQKLEIENAQMDDFHMLFDSRILSLLSTSPSPGSSGSSSPSDGTLSTDSSSDNEAPSPPPLLFPSLESLSIVPTRTHELAIIVSHLPGLRKLNATLEAEDRPSKYLARCCTSLRSLTLNTTYSDKVMPIAFVKSFRILSMLRTLDLSTGVDDNNMHALCKGLKGLTTLRIRNSHNLGEIGLAEIRTLPNLRCLYIDFGLRSLARRNAADSDLSWILRFKSMHSLTSLTFLLPHAFALKYIHETLLQHLRGLTRLQLGSIIWTA